MEPLLVTPRELSRLLKLGRNKTYELLASGAIPVIRFGRAIRIPRSAVERWLAEQSKERA
jgi:excisionase family DNA binding protein